MFSSKSLDINYQSILQERLNISMIMTPKNELKVCKLNDNILKLIKNNTESFTYLPVIDNSKNFIGVVNILKEINDFAKSQTVENFFQPISEKLIIGGNSSIIDFIKNIKEEPFKLVISKNKVSGFVTFSDLQKIPVRVSIFSLITELEIAISTFISNKFDNDNHWMKLLSKGRKEKINLKISQIKENDNYVSKIIFTELSDKLDIILKLKLLKLSGKVQKKYFEEITKIRNKVAHSSDYADSRENCNDTSKTINFISNLLDDISNLKIN